jgi:hypothetical protein
MPFTADLQDARLEIWLHLTMLGITRQLVSAMGGTGPTFAKRRQEMIDRISLINHHPSSFLLSPPLPPFTINHG